MAHMTPRIVVLGSTRKPKVQATERLLADLAAELGPTELRTLEAASAVSETPLDRAETMAGARNRVKSLQAIVPGGAFYVGLEGGLHAQRAQGGQVWLENWAYVSDGRRGYFGSGGALPVPDSIAQKVLLGESLGTVIDELTGQHDVRSGEGTWGILTNGRVSREEVFYRALLNAFAPFYSRTIAYT